MSRTERKTDCCSGFHLTLPLLTVAPEGREADVCLLIFLLFLFCHVCWRSRLSISVPPSPSFVYLNLFFLLCFIPATSTPFPSCLSIYFSISYSSLHLSLCRVGGCVGASVGVTSAAAGKSKAAAPSICIYSVIRV